MALGRLIFFLSRTFYSFMDLLQPIGSYPSFFILSIRSFRMSFYVSVRLTRLILGNCMLNDEFLGASSTSNSGCLGTSDHEIGSESLLLIS